MSGNGPATTGVRHWPTGGPANFWLPTWSPRPSCVSKEAWMPERVGRYSEAVRWIRRGLQMIEGVDGEYAGRLRAQLMTWYAAVRQAQGRSREAVTWCEQAITEARAFGDRDAEAHALFTLDSAWVWLGRTDLAANSHEALAIYNELGDLAGKAVVLNNLGAFEYFRGAWDEAASLYARGRDARLATGNDVDAAIGTINIGEILADQGSYEEGRQQLVDALRVLKSGQLPLRRRLRHHVARPARFRGPAHSRGPRQLRRRPLRIRRHRPPFRCLRGGLDGGRVLRPRGPEPGRHSIWPPDWSTPSRSRPRPAAWRSCSVSAATRSSRRVTSMVPVLPSRPAGTARRS